MQGRTVESPSLRDFRTLYRRHHGFVWHALHRFGVPPNFIDDAAQDTFVVAYRRRQDFEHGGSEKAWLYGIARRVASNHRRATARRTRREHAQMRWSEPRAESVVEAHEALAALEQFMDTLRPGDRELFILSELEGMTGPEISSALGKNLNTTYSRLRKLRRGFAEHCEPSRLLARVRDQRPRATQRGWAALVPSLSAMRPPGWWLPVAIKSPLVAVGSGVGVVALVGAMALRPSAPGDETPAAAVTRTASAADGELRESKARATVLARPVVDETDAAIDAPLVRPAVKGPSPLASTHTATPRRSVRQASLATKAEADTVAAETRMLGRAAQQLRQGRPDAALALTDRHARDFGSSSLEDLRSALRIESLCALGRQAQARGEARVFLACSKGSPVAKRIREACPTQNPSSPDKPGV